MRRHCTVGISLMYKASARNVGLGSPVEGSLMKEISLTLAVTTQSDRKSQSSGTRSSNMSSSDESLLLTESTNSLSKALYPIGHQHKTGWLQALSSRLEARGSSMTEALRPISLNSRLTSHLGLMSSLKSFACVTPEKVRAETISHTQFLAKTLKEDSRSREGSVSSTFWGLFSSRGIQASTCLQHPQSERRETPSRTLSRRGASTWTCSSSNLSDARIFTSQTNSRFLSGHIWTWREPSLFCQS